jgi:hypothetical protein
MSVRAWRARVRCIARALEGGVHPPPPPGNLRLLPAPRLLQHQEGFVHVIQLLQRQSLAVARLDACFIGRTSTRQQQHIGPHMHAPTV